MKIARQAWFVHTLRRCHLIRCSSVQPLAPFIIKTTCAFAAIRSRQSLHHFAIATRSSQSWP
jgi:hypothetical protein